MKLNNFDKAVVLTLSCYFLGAIPVALADGTTTRYFQGGARLLLCIPIYLSCRYYLSRATFSLREYLEYGVIIGSLLALLLALYQHFILKMARVDGFLFSINFGFLACSLGFLALTLSFSSNRRIWLSLAFGMCLVSIALTLTRGAMFAVPLLLVVCAIVYIKKVSIKLVTLGAIAFIVSSFLVYNYIDVVKNRIDTTIQEFSYIASGNIELSVSAGERLQYWFGATEAFKESPFYGLTYAEREQVNHHLFLSGEMGERASKVSRGHAHSQYFEMLASNGLLGIFSLFAVFIAPFYIFYRHYLKTGTDFSAVAAVFVLGFAIFGLTEVPLTANLLGSFYGFMLAIFFAIVASEKGKNLDRSE
ncbi:O-antigen ligase family protein [Vibrio bivalvicida]|nr:O-antigen ligase family protein [Vibrio bivalvicida]